MFRAYKYRIYPTLAQASLIEKTFGVCRLVYNLALQVKIEAYKANGTRMTAFDLCYQLAEMKQDYEWMREVDSQALQAAVKKVDVAFRNFFRGMGYPKFKSKKNKQSFQCPNNSRHVHFEKELLTIPKISNIPIRISRIFAGKIKTITISKEPSGKYFASILVDNGIAFPPKNSITSETMIGVDLGIKDFAIFSDGTKTDNPKHYKENLKRLKCLQRRVSRKKKGSKNRKKAIKQLAVQHEKVANMRKDFLHKLSSAITKRYDSVCVEDLAVSNMVKNRCLSQAISDVGWGEFIRQLQYKCDWGGKNFLQVPRFFASSKTCSNCGVKNEVLALADREWTCVNCQTIHDRDITAAVNIKQYFLKNSGEGISGEPVELLPIGGALKREYVKN